MALNRKVNKMETYSLKADRLKYFLITITLFCIVLISGFNSMAAVNYELAYPDPAEDVLHFNETWHLVEDDDPYLQIDLKWLESYNDTHGNVVLRLKARNNQIIEKSDNTSYVFRIFTKEDNSTGYNITYINETTTITDFNNTVEDDLTSETSIINEQGEVLLVNISKNDYLNNISYFNIDAFSWKEEGNHTFIDYISEVPGHPGETGDIVDNAGGNGNTDDEGLLGMLCSPLIIILIILAVIILIIIIVLLKR